MIKLNLLRKNYSFRGLNLENVEIGTGVLLINKDTRYIKITKHTNQTETKSIEILIDNDDLFKVYFIRIEKTIQKVSCSDSINFEKLKTLELPNIENAEKLTCFTSHTLKLPAIIFLSIEFGIFKTLFSNINKNLEELKTSKITYQKDSYRLDKLKFLSISNVSNKFVMKNNSSLIDFFNEANAFYLLNNSGLKSLEFSDSPETESISLYYYCDVEKITIRKMPKLKSIKFVFLADQLSKNIEIKIKSEKKFDFSIYPRALSEKVKINMTIINIDNIDQELNSNELRILNQSQHIEKECSICTLPIKGEALICPICNNDFHKDCMNKWKTQCLNKNVPFTCPLCRNENFGFK